MQDDASVIPAHRPPPKKRNLKKVPYVEMLDGRLQGVVSSGSSAERVYCSWLEAGGDYYCSTNNNRRCGGLGRGSCKHIDSMLTNAIAQYGTEAVMRFFGLEGDAAQFRGAWAFTSRLGGSERKEQASAVFSRFLHYLSSMDLEDSVAPLPEMTFFVTG